VRFHRYAKVVFLAPPIGGALLGVAGLAVGVGLIFGWGKGVSPNAMPTRQIAMAPGAAQQHTISEAAREVVPAARHEADGPVAALSAVRTTGAGRISERLHGKSVGRCGA
jgi:hypothetical protein